MFTRRRKETYVFPGTPSTPSCVRNVDRRVRDPRVSGDTDLVTNPVQSRVLYGQHSYLGSIQGTTFSSQNWSTGSDPRGTLVLVPITEKVRRLRTRVGFQWFRCKRLEPYVRKFLTVNLFNKGGRVEVQNLVILLFLLSWREVHEYAP